MTVVIKSSDNVFQALGFDAGEAAELKLRASLMAALKQWITTHELTQEDAATQLCTTQARISDILTGKINNLGIKRLLAMADAAAIDIEVHVKNAA